MTDLPLDILPALQSLVDGAPIGSGARATLEQAAAEIRALRSTATSAQASATQRLLEIRELRARVAGRPTVRVMRVGEHELPLPRYETDGAAGMDLRADVRGMDRLGHGVVRGQTGDQPWRLTIYPGSRALIPCGFAFEIPDGFEGQVRGRSGWMKKGLYASGTVDSDYRSTVFAMLEHRGAEPLYIDHGIRVAQLVISHAPQARLEEASELSPTCRGSGGFGSTGVT